MKKTIAVLLAIFTVPAIAGSLTISSLPTESEEPNPVCRDTNGKLTNCTANTGVERKYLAPIVVDGDSEELGTLIGFDDTYWTILSNKDYFFQLYYDGTLRWFTDAYYELADCQGNAYAREGHRGRVLYLYPYDNGSPFRYVAKDAVEADTAYLSKFNSGGFSCVNEDSSTSLIPLGINDLEVTGVADKGIWGVSEYAKPLVLQRP